MGGSVQLGVRVRGQGRGTTTAGPPAGDRAFPETQHGRYSTLWSRELPHVYTDMTSVLNRTDRRQWQIVWYIDVYRTALFRHHTEYEDVASTCLFHVFDYKTYFISQKTILML